MTLSEHIYRVGGFNPVEINALTNAELVEVINTALEARLAQRGTVGVDPEPPKQYPELTLNSANLRIDTYCKGGGGTWLKTNEVCVRVTHIPTGIAVHSEDERSVHQNRLNAMCSLQEAVKAHYATEPVTTPPKVEITHMELSCKGYSPFVMHYDKVIAEEYRKSGATVKLLCEFKENK